MSIQVYEGDGVERVSPPRNWAIRITSGRLSRWLAAYDKRSFTATDNPYEMKIFDDLMDVYTTLDHLRRLFDGYTYQEVEMRVP
jgi:hypothetical protein